MNTAVADEVIDSNPCRIRGAANTPRAREIRPATIDELEVIVEAMPEPSSCARAARARGAPCAVGRCSSCAARTSTSRQGRCGSSARCPGSAASPSSGPRSRRQARGWSPSRRTSSLRSPTTSSTMTAPGPDALLFPGRDGVSNLQPSTLHRHWRMAREAAGRPDLRVHDLRHTGATMAARAGATLAELQQRLGHSSVNAALRYQHAARGRDRRSPPPCQRWCALPGASRFASQPCLARPDRPGPRPQLAPCCAPRVPAHLDRASSPHDSARVTRNVPPLNQKRRQLHTRCIPDSRTFR